MGINYWWTSKHCHQLHQLVTNLSWAMCQSMFLLLISSSYFTVLGLDYMQKQISAKVQQVYPILVCACLCKKRKNCEYMTFYLLCNWIAFSLLFIIWLCSCQMMLPTSGYGPFLFIYYFKSSECFFTLTYTFSFYNTEINFLILFFFLFYSSVYLSHF